MDSYGKLRGYEDSIRGAVDAAWRPLCEQRSVYLYYTESTKTEPGTLFVVTDEAKVRADAKIVTGERLPGHLTREMLYRWVKERTGSVPLLAYGD